MKWGTAGRDRHSEEETEMRMTVNRRERAIVDAAREVDRLQVKRDKALERYGERYRLLRAKSEKEIADLDREIQAAKDALGTFVTGGQEDVSGPPRIMEPLLESLGARSER